MAAQWSGHDARVVLHAWQVSGQSIEEVALQRGFVPQRLRWWKKKLDDVAAPPHTKDVPFVPVRCRAQSRDADSNHSSE